MFKARRRRPAAMRGPPGLPPPVVADTGSSSVIVPSCVCVESGACDGQNRCFRGKDKSSTFSLAAGTNGQVETVMITFGSGQVAAVRAFDVAKVGGLAVNMSD